MQTKIYEKPYLVEAAECLKVMAHPARLHIVEILGDSEMPVHALAVALELPHHQTSEHFASDAGSRLSVESPGEA